MRIVFLYSELAGYTVNCLQTLRSLDPEIQLSVVRWPINKEAPFKFNLDGIEVYEKNDYTSEQLVNLVEKLNPDCLLVSGWMDKSYTSIAKKMVRRIPVVLTIDNHWRGDLKQIVASKLSRFLIRNKFNTVWVPGEAQARFARKLGFSQDKIYTGFYAADVNLFNHYFEEARDKKMTSYPRRLLYVGRYVQHKGIFDIWNAFVELQSENPNDWELWSVGTGDQWDNRVIHEKIRHLGFVQPDRFQEIIDQTSVYLLPSHFEPWGVSLHEFVAAGYPVLVSKNVGSSEAFCDGGKNGFQFDSGNIQEIKQKMKKLMGLTQKDYLLMSDNSRELARKITPIKWSETLMKIVHGKN